MAIPKLLANFSTSLASKMSSSASSFTLSRSTDLDGTTLSGTYFLTFDEGTSVEEHIIATLAGATGTVVTRGVSKVDAKTNKSANQFQHDRGAEVKITDIALIRVVNRLNGDEAFDSVTWTGVTSISGLDTPTSSESTKVANVGYVNSVAIAGGVDATTTVKGIAKLSTAAVSGTNPIVVGDNDTRVPTQNENDALVGTSGTPSSTNKFVTSDDVSATSSVSKIIRANSSGAIDSSWLFSAFTFGENVNGTTTPKAVFISDGTGGLSAGSVYMASATNVAQHANRLTGFTSGSITASGTGIVQTSGVVSGFSGLTPGKKYFLSGTQGAITDTPSATAVVVVGYAAAADKILCVPEKSVITGFGSKASGSTGTQAITGIGGRPQMIKIYAQRMHSNAYTGWSTGIATNTTNERCIYWYSSDDNRASSDNSELSNIDNTHIIHCSYNDSGGGEQVMSATMSSIDTDGFTLNWDVTNGDSTVNFIYEVWF